MVDFLLETGTESMSDEERDLALVSIARGMTASNGRLSKVIYYRTPATVAGSGAAHLQAGWITVGGGRSEQQMDFLQRGYVPLRGVPDVVHKPGRQHEQREANEETHRALNAAEARAQLRRQVLQGHINSP